jgi:branched-chain amino acid transport system ATP-binding protein
MTDRPGAKEAQRVTPDSGGLLRADRVSVAYGGVRANEDITIDVQSGKVVGLIGPNGAGKTTFIDALSGFAPNAIGDILLNGKNIDSLPPHKRAAAGLARTFQSIELFVDLTVRENLLIGAQTSQWWNLFVDMVNPARRSQEKAFSSAVELFELEECLDKLPRDLSLGMQKLVGVSRAIASGPQFLLLDEPAAGLDSTESQELGVKLGLVADSGIGLLLVDHDMGLVLKFCDYIYVLDFGVIIAEGTPGQIRRNPRVIQAYLGGANVEDPEAAGTNGANVALTSPEEDRNPGKIEPTLGMSGFPADRRNK